MTLVFWLLGICLFRVRCISLCGIAILGAHLPLPCALPSSGLVDDAGGRGDYNQPEALHCVAYAKLHLKFIIEATAFGYPLGIERAQGVETPVLGSPGLLDRLHDRAADDAQAEELSLGGGGGVLPHRVSAVLQPLRFLPLADACAGTRGDFRLLALLCFQRLPPLLWLVSSFVAENDFSSLLSLGASSPPCPVKTVDTRRPVRCTVWYPPGGLVLTLRLWWVVRSPGPSHRQ